MLLVLRACGLLATSRSARVGDPGATELRGEGNLFSECDLRSALLEDMEEDEEEETGCCVADIGWDVFDRELLRGDMTVCR